ncbi:MAG: FixH family protein [bacterium]
MTRVGRVRIEFPNRDGMLKPEMFVNVNLKINLDKKLAVPHDAVLNTGTEQYVFVDLGDGYFEPRPIKLVGETDEYYAIGDGLKPGERVVTAANFILDSESRLKGVFDQMGKPTGTEAISPAAMTSQLKIEVVEPKTAKVGKNSVRVTIKDPSGNPVTDAEVDMRLFMPQMGNMAPMSSTATLKHAGDGEYTGEIEFQMAWTWETTITVKKDGQMIGSMQTNITAR